MPRPVTAVDLKAINQIADLITQLNGWVVDIRAVGFDRHYAIDSHIGSLRAAETLFELDGAADRLADDLEAEHATPSEEERRCELADYRYKMARDDRMMAQWDARA